MWENYRLPSEMQSLSVILLLHTSRSELYSSSVILLHTSMSELHSSSVILLHTSMSELNSSSVILLHTSMSELHSSSVILSPRFIMTCRSSSLEMYPFPTQTPTFLYEQYIVVINVMDTTFHICRYKNSVKIKNNLSPSMSKILKASLISSSARIASTCQ